MTNSVPTTYNIIINIKKIVMNDKFIFIDLDYQHLSQ